MLSISAAALSFAPAAPLSGSVAPASRVAAPVMETKADLEALATKLNPIVGYWCVGTLLPPIQALPGSCGG